MTEVIIAGAVRTAIGNFQGSLSGFSATDLGGLAISEAVKRANIDKSLIDEVIMGNVVPIGLGQNPARQAMIKADLPMEAGAITVNKVCGSGLKSVMLAEQAIKCGDAEVSLQVAWKVCPICHTTWMQPGMDIEWVTVSSWTE